MRILHYINQFYAGIGGEEVADYKPELREGVVGPGLAMQTAFGDKAQIVNTIVCGDSYFNENLEDAKRKATESFSDADFGAAEDINGEEIIVEDAEGNYVWEKE